MMVVWKVSEKVEILLAKSGKVLRSIYKDQSEKDNQDGYPALLATRPKLPLPTNPQERHWKCINLDDSSPL
ncbi:hypothetical protein J6590_073648 [Homalodisca vitripennis]|nr:hypothetical protein J6590_073648 [Homalodisca vitripennis]